MCWPMSRAEGGSVSVQKWITRIMVVAVVAGAAYFALRPAGDRAGITGVREQGEAEVLPPVKADDTIRADGKVVPVRSATLSFATAGAVAEVLVKEGDKVRAGQVLVRLNSARQVAAVTQAEAQLSRATARLDELRSGARSQEIAAAQAALEGATARLARAKASGPPLEIAIAEAEARAAQAQLDLVRAGVRSETIAAAKAELTAAAATLEQARVTLAETELRAPFAGTVASLRSSPGEYMAVGNPVLRLVDESAWLVQTEDLTELGVVKVREGDSATVTLDAIPDLRLPGKVVRINPQGENRSGDITYTATIELIRLDKRLRWNMTASVAITGN